MFRSVCALYFCLAVSGSSQESFFHLTADCVLRPCALLLSPIYVGLFFSFVIFRTIWEPCSRCSVTGQVRKGWSLVVISLVVVLAPWLPQEGEAFSIVSLPGGQLFWPGSLAWYLMTDVDGSLSNPQACLLCWELCRDQWSCSGKGKIFFHQVQL